MNVNDQHHALAALTPEKNPSTRCKGRLMGPRAGVEILVKKNGREILLMCERYDLCLRVALRYSRQTFERPLACSR
jgi:hypothetical protein